MRFLRSHVGNTWAVVGAAAAAFLLVVAGVVVYVATQPDEYTATAHMSLSPKENVGADNVELAASRYSALLSSAATTSAVSEAVGMSAAKANDAVRVSVPSKTVTLTVTVTLSDPVKAAQVANLITDIAAEQGKKDAFVTVELMASAVPPRSPDGPPQAFLLLAGGVAGVLAAGGAAALLVFLRREPR